MGANLEGFVEEAVFGDVVIELSFEASRFVVED